MTTPALNSTDLSQALDSVFLANADKPSENRLEMTYEELRLTPDDRKNIDTMISLLALNNIILVSLNTSSITSAGNSIWGVHTFKILEHAVTSKDLKPKIQTIFNYSTYWLSLLNIIKTQFFSGSVRCLTGNMEVTLKHLPSFAKAIGKEDRISELQAIVETAESSKDWDVFFKIVLDL